MEKNVFCNKIGCEGHSNLIVCKCNFFFGEHFYYNVDRKCMDKLLSCQVKDLTFKMLIIIMRALMHPTNLQGGLPTF